MGPTWGPSGADRTQVGPMLAPWTLLSWIASYPSFQADLYSKHSRTWSQRQLFFRQRQIVYSLDNQRNFNLLYMLYQHCMKVLWLRSNLADEGFLSLYIYISYIYISCNNAVSLSCGNLGTTINDNARKSISRFACKISAFLVRPRCANIYHY